MNLQIIRGHKCYFLQTSTLALIVAFAFFCYSTKVLQMPSENLQLVEDARSIVS